jgi:hypothetical protein
MRAALTVVTLAVVLVACSDGPDGPTQPVNPSSVFEAFTEIGGGCSDQFTLGGAGKYPAGYKVVGRDPVDDNGDFYVCTLAAKDPVYNIPGDPKSGINSTTTFRQARSGGAP